MPQNFFPSWFPTFYDMVKGSYLGHAHILRIFYSSNLKKVQKASASWIFLNLTNLTLGNIPDEFDPHKFLKVWNDLG